MPNTDCLPEPPEAHEVVAKLLADAMIELHNTEFGDLDEETARPVLKWGQRVRRNGFR